MNRNPDYFFTGEIRSRLAGFKAHLQELGDGENTIRQKMNYAGYFLTWLDKEHLTTDQVSYNDMLCFIDHCRLEDKSKRLTNRMLSCIRNYYQYLKEMNPEITNPALNLNLRGVQRKVPAGMIRYRALEDLYRSWPRKTSKDKRNRVILGLLIYQGVTTGELSRLEVGHVNLDKKKIRIPGTPRSNSRVLSLHKDQVKELGQYLARTRPKILREVSKSKPARKPDRINQERIQEQLVISINGSEHIKSSLHFLFKQVREQMPELQQPKQIRTSVITHWLREHNLRQVQYMAGHKHVGSTEHYQMGNLAGLQSKLEKFHPLNQTKSE